MEIIFSLIYLLFIIGVTIVSFFIVTNLQKYSINPRFTKPIVFMYIIITIILAIINFVLFISIPFEDFFYNNNLYY